MKEIHIESLHIGPNHAPMIIAEISGNHKGSLELLLELVDQAYKAGVHAVKLQTYTPDTMTLNLKEGRFLLSSENSLWKGRSLYELYQEAYTPWEWHDKVFAHCKKYGLVCFSTPFDETAVDFLESLKVPCYKVASLEIQNLPVLKKIAQTGKPILISTGIATLAEIDDAVRTVRDCGNNEIILLKCTSSYPAPASSINLKTIKHMSEAFKVPVGLSDHTQGVGVALASISHGACVIEKHITLSRKDGSVDAAFSLEPHEFKLLVDESHSAWLAQGEVFYGMDPSEEIEIINKRSLYFVKDLKAGDVVTKETIRAIKPAGGVSPKYLDVILGMQIRHDVKCGTPVSFDLFKISSFS